MSARRGPGRAVLAALLVCAVGGALYSSFGRIEKNEQGVLLRFGRVQRVLPPGVHLKLPWPAGQLVRVATTEVRTVAVGGPSQVDVGGNDDGAEGQWITGDTNIISLELAVQYTIIDPERYLFAVEHDGSADALVRSVGESVVTGLVARRGIDDLLAAGKAELQIAARGAIQARLTELQSGVHLAGVTITSAAPPAQVIGAFNDVTSAASDRVRDVNRADGYRRDLLPNERARANRLVQEARQVEDALENEARGRAQSFTALCEEFEKSAANARRRLWLERVTALLGRSRAKIYPAGTPFKLTIVE